MGPGGCGLAAPVRAGGGITLSVCFVMTGEVSGAGGFVDQSVDPAALSCPDWAARGGHSSGVSRGVLFLPDPGDSRVSVDGQPVSFSLEIGGYHGPGRYGASGLVETATWGTTTSWSTNAAPPATFSATVGADGSGTVSASGLRADSGGGGQESITETWTCAMVAGG